MVQFNPIKPPNQCIFFMDIEHPHGPSSFAGAVSSSPPPWALDGDSEGFAEGDHHAYSLDIL